MGGSVLSCVECGGSRESIPGLTASATDNMPETHNRYSRLGEAGSNRQKEPNIRILALE